MRRTNNEKPVEIPAIKKISRCHKFTTVTLHFCSKHDLQIRAIEITNPRYRILSSTKQTKTQPSKRLGFVFYEK